MDFADKHVVVTGASGGLGPAVVGALIERGAVCHVPMRKPESQPAWAAHERVHTIYGVDLLVESSVEALYAGLPELWASIHLVGGFGMGPIAETSLAELRRMLALNLETCFLSCREATKAIRKSGKGGRIVNVASRPAVQPVPGMLAYSTSKAAIAGLTQALAAELKSERILVNAVLPSLFDTEANRAAMPDADHDAWPKPEEIAESICFLASPRNQLTHGALLPVYGQV